MYLVSDNLFFSDWLNEQLRKRNWTQSDLAKAAGLGRAVINKVINQVNKKPDPATCVAISRGLKMSPITVFVAAGLLPQMPERLADLDDFESILTQMSEDRREDLLTIARAMLALDTNRGKRF